MKKLLFIFFMSIMFFSCNPAKEDKELSKGAKNVSDVFAEYDNAPKVKKAAQKKTDKNADISEENVDIDFSKMDKNMIYSIVYNIVFEPDQYIGKKMRIRGESYSVFHEPLNATIHTVIVKDATACCVQGLSYILPKGTEYPEDGLDVEVTGIFETFENDGIEYTHLRCSKNARIF